MTRKRFKKLCMGYCVSRDNAERLSFAVWLLCPSFAAAWPSIRAELSDALADVLREIAEERAADGGDGGAMRASLPTREEVARCE